MPAIVRHAVWMAATGVAKFILCVFPWPPRIRHQPNTAFDSCGRRNCGVAKRGSNPNNPAHASHLIRPL